MPKSDLNRPVPSEPLVDNNVDMYDISHFTLDIIMSSYGYV